MKMSVDGVSPRIYADLSVFNATGLKGAEVELELHEILMPILGMLIIIINLIVLVSSGLFLHRGQQPRTTYLFLGNIALADVVIGISLLFGQWYPRKYRTDMVCAIEIGMLVSANLTSVYSIGLIAIDRFLYILSGLRYQKYIYPTRARIMIFVAWATGILVGFIPAMGYRSDTDNGKMCWFILIEPPPLILMTTTFGSVPLILTVILYSIILYHALKKTAQLKSAAHNVHGTSSGNLRIFRGGIHSSTPSERSSHEAAPIATQTPMSESEDSGCCFMCRRNRTQRPTPPIYNPSKWKAIKIVLFTTGAFSVTWLPYFIASAIYAFSTSPKNSKFREQLQIAIASPLAILGVTNSLLNPIVYAWWHPGFRNSFKKLWRKCRGQSYSPRNSRSPSNSRSHAHQRIHIRDSEEPNPPEATPIMNSRPPSRTHSNGRSSGIGRQTRQKVDPTIARVMETES